MWRFVNESCFEKKSARGDCSVIANCVKISEQRFTMCALSSSLFCVELDEKIHV